MSRNEWERGDFTLPAGVSPKLREHLNAAADRRIADLERQTSAAWDELKTKPVGKRIDALYDLRVPMSEDALALMRRYDPQTHTFHVQRPSKARIAESVRRREKVHDQKTWGEVTATVFHCGSEATIALIGSNRVQWDVPESNHAVERAREHPLAETLFDYLEHRVPWTARSGGSVVGNDEYNRDADYDGGGANYTKERYGRAKTDYEKHMAAMGRAMLKRTPKPRTPKPKPVKPSLAKKAPAPKKAPTYPVTEKVGQFAFGFAPRLFKVRYDGAGTPTTIQVADEASGWKWSPSRSVAAGVGKENLDAVAAVAPANRRPIQAVAALYGLTTGSCLTCGKKLTDPMSQARGYGRECAAKLR